MKYSTRRASWYLRFSSSSFFGKFVLLGSKKIWSVLLVVFLFLSFSVTSFADDEILEVSQMGVTMQRQVIEGSSTVTYNYAYTDGTLTRNGILLHWFSAKDPSFYASGGKKLTTVYDYGNLAAGHEYEMTFYTGVSFAASYNIRVFVGSEKVFDNDFSSTSGISKNNVKLTTPSAITNSTRIQIVMTVPEQFNYGANGETVRYYFSENLDFTDLTENPKWLTKIKQWFLDLGDKVGGFFTSLGDRISGFFTDLKTDIGKWFSEQGQKIKDFYDGVKQWFIDLGDKIKQSFIDLYNDIIEGLKSLFIPADGYFDSKKTELETFSNEHFGAMYQAPSVMADLIKKFLTLSPKQPSITMPAIQFDFDGKRYVFSESITYSFAWVNDSSHMLYYFYKFYRGFVTVLLFVWFGNFCINKYNEVFGGRQE